MMRCPPVDATYVSTWLSVTQLAAWEQCSRPATFERGGVFLCAEHEDFLGYEVTGDWPVDRNRHAVDRNRHDELMLRMRSEEGGHAKDCACGWCKPLEVKP